MNKPDIMMSLVLGDWSGDGHSISSQINILSNIDKEILLSAYVKGVEILGFDLINNVCSDFENNSLSSANLKALTKHGFKFTELSSYEEKDLEVCLKKDSDEDFRLSPSQYSEIFLFIVKLGNKNFQYEILTQKSCPTIDIGGYGLFCK